MMADAFLYTFVSVASIMLTGRTIYNRILNLFHFSHAASPIAHKTNTQKETISIFNRSFEKNYASA